MSTKSACAEAASRLRELRIGRMTAHAWQRIPLYIRAEIEAVEGELYKSTQTPDTGNAEIMRAARTIMRRIRAEVIGLSNASSDAVWRIVADEISKLP